MREGWREPCIAAERHEALAGNEPLFHPPGLDIESVDDRTTTRGAAECPAAPSTDTDERLTSLEGPERGQIHTRRVTAKDVFT